MIAELGREEGKKLEVWKECEEAEKWEEPL
jgi:hypothetical protein